MACETDVTLNIKHYEYNQYIQGSKKDKNVEKVFSGRKSNFMYA
jgi:hypothetical protein